MRARPRALSAMITALLFSTILSTGPLIARDLEVEKNDRIVILGNTFAERMRLFGYFEAFLHSRFPDHQLTIRNMGWPADEVDKMIRPHGFPKLFDELEALKADMIFICFGMNESFQGPGRVGHYRNELGKLVRKLRNQKFNGKSAPRIVLVSPIAHETLSGDLPDGTEHHRNLSLYVKATSEVAREHKADYVDLFSPTKEWMAAHTGKRLTFNGIHLTEYGDWVVSRMMARSLGLVEKDPGPAAGDSPVAETLRRAIYEKNFHSFTWWHPSNASYIHGRRRKTGGSKHLASERKQQVRLIEAYDRKIWSMAKPLPSEVWGRVPKDGRPVWFPTPADSRIPGVKKEAQLSVKGDGDADARVRDPGEQHALLNVPPGYRVNLFASEARFPIANPMAIQFDARGRLWVANTPTWPHPLPGKQPRDSLIVLEDADRDGKADRHTVFLDKLNLLHGFALVRGGAYVAQTPFLTLARDTDGDDRADWVRRVLSGFGAEDAEHAMNNFRWSPGGSIFFTQGIFYNTQVETPHGPVRVRDSAVFRYRPGEERLDIYASHHFWNPYGNVFGRWGRGILLDASAGQYYPMDVVSSNFIYPKRKKRAEELNFSRGGSIAAGCDFLYSRHFPEDVQGRFLVNHCEGDIGTHWYTLESNGSLYKAERHDPPLLTSRDKTFRPVAMAIGPDGALYVADFYSHIFENVAYSKRHPGRDHSHGRIWRITHANRPLLTAPRIEGRPVPELLDLLKSPEANTREFARRELKERGREKVVPPLKKWIAELQQADADTEHHLTEALWVHQSVNAVDPDLLRKLLSAKDPGARIAATHVLRFWQGKIEGSIDLLRERINDPDARVRLQAVLACGFSDSEKARLTLLEVTKHRMDPGLKHALDRTFDYFENVKRLKRRR